MFDNSVDSWLIDLRSKSKWITLLEERRVRRQGRRRRKGENKKKRKMKRSQTFTIIPCFVEWRIEETNQLINHCRNEEDLTEATKGLTLEEKEKEEEEEEKKEENIFLASAKAPVKKEKKKWVQTWTWKIVDYCIPTAGAILIQLSTCKSKWREDRPFPRLLSVISKGLR